MRRILRIIRIARIVLLALAPFMIWYVGNVGVAVFARHDVSSLGNAGELFRLLLPKALTGTHPPRWSEVVLSVFIALLFFTCIWAVTAQMGEMARGITSALVGRRTNRKLKHQNTAVSSPSNLLLLSTIPRSKRSDPYVRECLLAVQEEERNAGPGDSNAAAALNRLHSQIMIPKIAPERRDLYQESRLGSPDARVTIYQQLREELQAQIDRNLRPRTAGISYPEWYNLVGETRLGAEILWRDYFYSNSPVAGTRRMARRGSGAPEQVSSMEQRTLYSRQLMLLWIEASLYEKRAIYNEQTHSPTRRDRRRKEEIRDYIRKLVHDYRSTLHQWDDELENLTGRRYFSEQAGDVPQFRVLTREFGPSGTDTSESGWLAQATDAKNELRYQYLDAQLKENWRDRRLIDVAVGFILRITTGYGTKPYLLFRTVVLTILTFTLLFFLNDLFNQGLGTDARFCPQAHIRSISLTNVLPILIHYLYVAVTNLTSLGTNAGLAQSCGGSMTEILLICSALSGYVLLATLASMLYQRVTEGEG